MKDLTTLDEFRDRRGEMKFAGAYGGATEGMFIVQCNRIMLVVIAAVGGGWEHVSASSRVRCPTWAEMEFVKRMFFEDHETVMQLHVPATEHVNVHPFCLHLWRPVGVEIPRPPAFMV